MESATHLTLSSLSLLQQIDWLEKQDVDDLRSQLEFSLAANVAQAEAIAVRRDKSGEMARNLLESVKAHRSNPLFILEENRYRIMVAETQKAR